MKKLSKLMQNVKKAASKNKRANPVSIMAANRYENRKALETAKSDYQKQILELQNKIIKVDKNIKNLG